MMPEWNYPLVYENTRAVIEKFYDLEKDSIQVALLGTSHANCGVSPMKIYEQEKITSYNFGTSAQARTISLFFLKELFQTQKPAVVVWDASNLFYDSSIEDQEEKSYWHVFDSVPLSRNKLELISSYAANRCSGYSAGDPETSMLKTWLSILVPFYQYHTRWDELNERDIVKQKTSGYFEFGYSMLSQIMPGLLTDDMNAAVDVMNENSELRRTSYENGIYSVERSPADPLYPEQSVSEENMELLREMAQICTENGSQLLLVNVPVSYNPVHYPTAWTKQRTQAAWAAAEKVGVEFLDLLYNSDLRIDWTLDSFDGGKHLNFLGAEKVSTYLAHYLKERYALPPQENAAYDDALERYQKAAAVAKLHMGTSLQGYLNTLRENERQFVVCIATCNDTRTGLNDEDIQSLKDLGLQTDFMAMEFQDSFLALIDGGRVLYESVCNRTQTYAATLFDGTALEMVSAGWYSENRASIQIDESEYAINNRGLNFVVYDKETHMVVDSSVFDTYIADHSVIKGDGLNMLGEFKLRLMAQ